MTYEQKKEAIRSLLTIAAAGAIIPAALIAPGSLRIIHWLIQKQSKRQDPRLVKGAFMAVRKEKLILFHEENGGIRITLSAKGKRRYLKYNLDNLVIDRPRTWDGKWRIVIFDIPETFKQNRDIFRQKLKMLGFHQLQKSTWIIPYDCKPQIQFLTHTLDINRFIVFVETSNLDSPYLPYTF